MNTIYLYILVIIILIVIYFVASRYSKPKEISKDEDIAYSKISLSREILNKIGNSEINKRFEDEIERCEKLAEMKDYAAAEKCAEEVLSELRKIMGSKRIESENEGGIICPRCGTKLAKKYEKCPICGEKL